MTPEQKEVYDLTQSGMKMQEIADKLGIKYNAAKSRLRRAEAFLNADPSAQAAANAVGSGLIPTAVNAPPPNRFSGYARAARAIHLTVGLCRWAVGESYSRAAGEGRLS